MINTFITSWLINIVSTDIKSQQLLY